jgi:hypothetical protein
MLSDPNAQRYERLLFTLRLNHHVRMPSVEGGEQRVPVSDIDRVGVRPGLLMWVLAREVDLRARSAYFPGRQREVKCFSQR